MLFKIATLLFFALPILSLTAHAEEKDLNETHIEPHFAYRFVSFVERRDSVFHNFENDIDFADQLYLNLKFDKIYDLRHEVYIEPSIRTDRDNPGDIYLQTVIEQAFVRSEVTKHLVLTAGKKTEFDGSGFLMNPSDLLNEGRDNLFDPLYIQEGQIFTRLTFNAHNKSLGLGFIPAARPARRDSSRLWLQGQAQILETDIHTQYTYQVYDKHTFGLSVAHFFTDALELHWDGRYQLRQRVIDDVNSERNYSAYQGHDPSFFILGGTRYVFTPRRTAIFELMQNQAGLSKDEESTFFHAIDPATTHATLPPLPIYHLIGRRYAVLAYLDEESIKKTTFNYSSTMNLDDQSIFASITYKYFWSPLTSFELTPSIFSGQRWTEFGEYQFSQAVYFMFNGRF